MEIDTSPPRRGLAAVAAVALLVGGVALGVTREVDSPCRCVNAHCRDGERISAEVRIVHAPTPHVVCSHGDAALLLPPPPQTWQRGLDLLAQPGVPGAEAIWRRPVISAGVTGVWQDGALHVDVWLAHPGRSGKRVAAVVAVALWLFATWRAGRTWPT